MTKRLVALLLAAPLAFAPAASADPLVPGCYGVGDTTVCDPVAYVTGVGWREERVCVSTCQYVSVPVVQSRDLAVCVDYADADGGSHRVCTGRSMAVAPIVQQVCNATNLC